MEGFCGHGINEFFHTAPDIYHYRGSPFNGRMEVGHIFTIEPMINFGSKHCKMWNDDWTIVIINNNTYYRLFLSHNY